MKPIIKAMQEWLRTCPVIEEQGAALRINFLGAGPVEFSIEDSPVDPVLLRYFSGSLRAKNYVLASRMEYSEQIALQAANSGAFERLADWVEAQDKAGNFPVPGGTQQPRRVTVTTTGYIITSAAGTCRMQIQLQLQYYQPKGAVEP